MGIMSLRLNLDKKDPPVLAMFKLNKYKRGLSWN
jgi:hypothetical protein